MKSLSQRNKLKMSDSKIRLIILSNKKQRMNKALGLLVVQPYCNKQ